MRTPHLTWSMILAAALAATPFGTCAQPARGITQVTDNPHDDVTPKVSGDHLVWRGFDGHDWEMYHRIEGATTALTTNALDDGNWSGLSSAFSSQIRVSGSYVAWCGDVGNYYELFVHNGLTTTQVTYNNVYDNVGGISDGRVAFTSERVRAGLIQDLYLFDGTTTRHIATGPLIGPPSVSGNVIAWDSGTTYAHLEIFVYDGTEIRQVSHTGSAVNPRISGRRVVWEAERNNGKSLYSYDVDTQVTSLLVVVPHYNSTVLSFMGDRILYRSPADGDAELFVYDFATGQSTRLTDNDRDDYRAAMYGDVVAWEGFDGHDWEIFAHDMRMGKTIQLTDNEVDDRNPDLSDSMVVWQTFDGHDWEIFQCATADLLFLSISRNGDGTVTIRWSGAGALECSPTVDHDYHPLAGATSPYTFEPEGAMFFRLAQ